jgi:hypothetical protein
MSLHDDYARLTPVEIAFPDRRALEELSAEVGKEAERRGVDDTTSEAFMTLSMVGELARTMRGPDAPPESTVPFAMLLYHGVHFLRAGRPLYLLDTGATRAIVSTSPDAGGPHPPTSAGYLQLPQHLVWTRSTQSARPPDEARVPESIDGAFWTLSSSGMLHALPVSGVLPERPGFGALPLPPAPIADAHQWLDAEVRASGGDFRSTLPGSELDALYEVEAAGEVLKLLARFFVLAESGHARLTACSGAEPTGVAGAGKPAGAPRPSALPYTRVSLGG